MSHKRSQQHKGLKFLLVICSAFSASVSQAEYFGSINGRSAHFINQERLSVEASYSNGEFTTADYKQLSIRTNYKYSSKIQLFGDVGQSQLNSANQTSVGFGAFYSLGKSLVGSNSAIKMSFHHVNFNRVAGTSYTSSNGRGLELKCGPYVSPFWGPDYTTYECEAVPNTSSTTTRTTPARGGDIRNISLEYLVSGSISTAPMARGMSWYANGGIQLLNGEFVDDTVLGFGAGIVLPILKSEVYAGFDYADEVFVGVGYRYFVK